MNVLVINAGSSSLKYQLMDPATGNVTAKGLCERIGLDGRLTHKVPATGKKVEKDIPMPTHKEAIEAVMAILVDPADGVIKSVDEIDAVGHRVLHGGDKFVESCIIDEACKQAIRDCIPLGPLHNPANLMGIEACEKAMPGKPQVAVFDTAFHMTMPPKAYRYAIPTKYYTEDHLRRYGFHGTSHRFVSKRCIELMGGVENAHRVIVCHLGNGSSLSAAKDGKCQDTSMGLSPLAGVPMGTRAGDIDTCVAQFIMNKYNMSADDCLTMLNKKSGVLALSDGVSSDFRDLDAAAERATRLRSSRSTSSPMKSASTSVPTRLRSAAWTASSSRPVSARTPAPCARPSATVWSTSASSSTRKRTSSAAKRSSSPPPTPRSRSGSSRPTKNS